MAAAGFLIAYMVVGSVFTAIYYAVFEGSVIAVAATSVVDGLSYGTACILVVAYSVPLVFGTYNAGHIWPGRGNEWLRLFFADPWFRGTPAPPPDAPPLAPPTGPAPSRGAAPG